MEMMLDKKQIQAIFLFEFKMGHKAAKTTCNINTFGPGTGNECTVQYGSRSFAKQMRALEMSTQWPAIGNWQPPRTSSKLILLQLHKKLLKNSVLAIHSTIIWHLKQIGKVKKLNR